MKKVLIVDPSRPFAGFLRLVLSRFGYQAIHAPDAATAQYLLGGAAPDLVITETALPGMGGVELCRRIRGSERGAVIPVLVLARDGSPLTREAALAAGCDEFLTKPVTARVLHELMQKHLPFSPRRKTLRARMEATATVAVREGKTVGWRKETLRTVSVGEGGLFLRRTTPFPEGTALDISLTLPNLKRPLHLDAEVSYALPEPRGKLEQGMGVRFTGLDPNTSTLFTHYLENYVSGFVRGGEIPALRVS